MGVMDEERARRIASGRRDSGADEILFALRHALRLLDEARATPRAPTEREVNAACAPLMAQFRPSRAEWNLDARAAMVALMGAGVSESVPQAEWFSKYAALVADGLAAERAQRAAGKS